MLKFMNVRPLIAVQVSLASFAFVAILQVGCGVNDAAKTIGGSLEATSQNVKAGLDNLSAGVAQVSKIDPVGINRLLNENKDLREQLDTIRYKLDSYGNGGVVVEIGSNSRVVFQISGYRGAMTLDAWVDSELPDNMFMRSVELVHQTGKYPEVTYNIATEAVFATAKQSWMENSGNHPFDSWDFLVHNPAGASVFVVRMGALRGQIDASYNQAVNAAFDKLLKNSFSAPTPESGVAGPQAIAHRFLQGGHHQVFVRVTPQGPDESGHWSFAARTYIEHPADPANTGTPNQEQVDVLNMNDKDYGTIWNQKLKPVQAAGFLVRVAKGQSQ
jgi:hypothetical protein